MWPARRARRRSSSRHWSGARYGTTRPPRRNHLRRTEHRSRCGSGPTWWVPLPEADGVESQSDALEDFAARARTAARTSRIDVETVEILDACGAVSAEPLVLKGVALVRTL